MERSSPLLRCESVCKMITNQGALNAPSIETAPITDGEQAPSLLQLPGDVLIDILNIADAGYARYGNSSCLSPGGLYAVYSSCRMARTALLPWIGRRVINVPSESKDEDGSDYDDYFEGPKDYLVQRLLCNKFPRGAMLRCLHLELSYGMGEHLETLLDSPAAADSLASVTDLCLVVGNLEVGRVCSETMRVWNKGQGCLPLFQQVEIPRGGWDFVSLCMV